MFCTFTSKNVFWSPDWTISLLQLLKQFNQSLEYILFSPFLILTPTYQLIYVIIAIVVIMVGGVLLNDVKGGNS